MIGRTLKSRPRERIDGFYLQPRIWKLKGGKYKYWKGEFEEQEKYKNELKNKPVYTLKEEYMGY